MNFMMTSCEKATELIDKRHAVGLSLAEHVKLRLHTAMCDACRLYEKQSRVLESLLGKELGNSRPGESIPSDRSRQLIERILSREK
jgi:hypothetical protein